MHTGKTVLIFHTKLPCCKRILRCIVSGIKQLVEKLAFDWILPKVLTCFKPTKHKQLLVNNQRVLKKLSKFVNKDHTITKPGINLSSTIAGWQSMKLSNHIHVLPMKMINSFNESNKNI